MPAGPPMQSSSPPREGAGRGPSNSKTCEVQISRGGFVGADRPTDSGSQWHPTHGMPATDSSIHVATAPRLPVCSAMKASGAVSGRGRTGDGFDGDKNTSGAGGLGCAEARAAKAAARAHTLFRLPFSLPDPFGGIYGGLTWAPERGTQRPASPSRGAFQNESSSSCCAKGVQTHN